MSKINTDAVEPSTGTSLVLGASGDTISIPAVATITNAGTSSGFGKEVQAVTTQDYGGGIEVDGVTTYATMGSDFAVSITPTGTSSKILILASSGRAKLDGNTSYAGEIKIYRQIASGGYSSINTSPVVHINGADGKFRPWSFQYLDSPNTTSQVDYQLYMRASGNAVISFASDTHYRSITVVEIGG